MFTMDNNNMNNNHNHNVNDNDNSNNKDNNNNDTTTTNTDNNLWVFGYGSLIWNPGFPYKTATIGYVKGYVRRFWQGNSVQRGTADQPGRVVTLIEEGEGYTWGVAFELTEEDVSTTFNYLHSRETDMGGYRTSVVKFQPKDAGQSPFPVLVYVATPESSSYMGPAPVKELANQIVEASGICGHNVEYLVRLADFMRHTLPEVDDDHLYTLEDHVRTKIKERNLCFRTLMGANYVEPGYRKDPGNRATGESATRLDGAGDDPNASAGHDLIIRSGADLDAKLRPCEGSSSSSSSSSSTFLYASRIPPKKLRCLNL